MAARASFQLPPPPPPPPNPPQRASESPLHSNGITRVNGRRQMDEQGVQFGLAIDRDGLRLNVAVDGRNGHAKIGVNVDTDNKVEIVVSVEEPATGRVDTKPVVSIHGKIREREEQVVAVENRIEDSGTVEDSDVEMRDGEGNDQDVEMME
ncbi:hypothetical protein JR316_0007789 [Psilocybe cubensis]|uniref:Uncharacterized protein n=2 Tax=Psilocybe cubensis TaxID=181762 RepID=A0A8H7XUH3_PSICU|nr:hypothetical protein JR316_0007789 [Psilocybe cubensis]KAH9479203.1 hypothetical protein JR316_0007789 [Psilocybe cubensis]